MRAISLNADMGEGFAIYNFGNDEGLMTVVDTANIACGFHASDFNHMRSTVSLAKRHGVAIGAHPSLPDRQGFGRREMKMPRDELANCILYQVGALTAFLRAEGLPLNHIKPHGVLYGMATRDPEVMHAVADAAEIYSVPVFGLPGTLHETVLAERGIPLIAEFFPDLDYDEAGALLIVKKAPDVDPAVAAARTTEAIRDGVRTAEGRVPIATVCIHSDRGNSIAVAQAVASAIRVVTSAK
jgi:UPF0271 protein